MPRKNGHDKQAMLRRNAAEDREFTERFIVDDLKLLSLLLKLEMEKKDYPSDLLQNAAAIVERLQKYYEEIEET